MAAPDLERWSGDVVLADGGTVHVRPIVPADAPGVEALGERLSSETVFYRFFSPLRRLPPAMLKRFTEVDYDDRFALVAELGSDLVAVARYDRLASDPATAEVAFTVEDAHQGRGLGSLLLEQLAVVARHRGIGRFVADTLPGNEKMLRVFRDAGFGDERRFADGVIRVTFPISPTEASRAAQHRREAAASASSVRRFLAPTSVAVVGASPRPDAVGHVVLVNLLRGGFEGPVYPVHKTAQHVASVRAWPSVLDVPDVVDLAVVAVPAEEVPAIVDECARKRVGGIVVVSSGFADAGPDGARREAELVALARRSGLRVVGPASMGVANTDPAVRLQATVSPTFARPGRIGFVSQSGALGIALLDELDRIGLGVTSFVSLGNRADVSTNDLLDYWDTDPATEVILLHVERFGNPRRFARTARRVSRTKPVVALKAKGGGRPDVAADALFAQAGVLRVDTFDQLFSAARALATQPLPAGPRVAVVGIGGGSTLVAGEAVVKEGLELAALSPATAARLADEAGVEAADNPLNLPAPATAPDLGRALEIVLADPAVDSAMAVHLPALASSPAGAAEAVAAAAATAPAKPVVGLFLVRDKRLEARAEGAGRSVVPLYRFPESAATALASLVRVAAHRGRPDGELVDPGGVDLDRIAALVERALAAHPDGTWLDLAGALELARSAGLEVAPVEPLASATGGEVAALAERVGLPALVHPGRGRDPVLCPTSAALDAALAAADRDAGAAVGPAPPPGRRAVLVEVAPDPDFGPLLAVRRDGAAPLHRILPLTDLDAEEVAASAAPGEAASPLARTLLRVHHVVENVPTVARLLAGPVAVTGDSAVVFGVAVRVAPAEPHPEAALRRL